MKRRFIYVMAGCLALSLSACGGGSEAGNEETGKKEATEKQTKKEINVTPKTVEVSGDMFGCFKVVDRTYKAIGDEWSSIITVEIERTDVALPFDLSRDIESFGRCGDGDYVNVGFGIEFYDKDGNSISKTTPNTLQGSYDPEEAVMIVKLRSGDTGSIRFDAVDGAASFKLTSAYRDNHSDVNTPAKEEDASDDAKGNITIENVILPSSIKDKVKVIEAGQVTMDKYGYPNLMVTFELIETVNTKPLGNEYGQFWIVGIAQDEKGATIKDLMPNYNEWRSEDSSGDMIKEFLEGEPGNTLSLTFTGANNIELFEKDNEKIKAGNEKTQAGIDRMHKLKLVITKPF